MEEIQHVAIDAQVPAGFSEEKKIGIIRVEEEDVAVDELQNFIKKLDEVPGEPFKPRPDNPLFLGPISRSATGEPPKISCNNIYHLLHFHYISKVGNNELAELSMRQKNQVHGEYPSRAATKPQKLWKDKANMSRIKESTTNPIGIPCARMLHEAGVTFRRKKNPRDEFDISFKNGIMEIPFFLLSSGLKILIANGAAYEQTQGYFYSKPPITSHLALMDALINTEEDIAILERNGILENILRTEEDAADFFNDLGELFVLEKYNGSPLFDEIRKYSNKTWHKQRARLIHDYFSNPWSAISVGAAIILLVLSILQTYYSATK